MSSSHIVPATVHGGDTSPSSFSSSSSSSLSDIDPDILQNHILTRLDGPTLASAASTSTELNSLGSDHHLWTTLCSSTWPSTATPRLQRLISSFPHGPRSFFSLSFPLILHSAASATVQEAPSEIISAVDIYYRDDLIFSKVLETETISGWFINSPFRIDMLEPKDTWPTPIRYSDDKCVELLEELTLSWILIDPVGPRAMNLSSYKPVSVERHWLSGEIHARYSAILAGDRGTASEYVHCGIVVTCGVSRGGGMHVREVSLQMENMDGLLMNGKDSLGILHSGYEGKRGNIRNREMEGKKMYREFLERKKERKERKERNEGTLDMLGIVFGVVGVASLVSFVLSNI